MISTLQTYIANCLNVMGKIDHYDKAVFDRLLCALLVKAGDFNAQNIVNLLLALVSVHNEKAVSVLLKELCT